MKYKLISKTTGEEHLCDKVTIDGFEYYYNDDFFGDEDWYYDTKQETIRFGSNNHVTGGYKKKAIACNNPNMDIPQAIEYSDILEDMAVTSTEENEIDDSIEYGHRLGFINGYNKSQETHPFSEEDMIEFGQWVSHNDWVYLPSKKYWVNEEQEELEQKLTSKELLQLWKEQQTKIIYYE
jgi:hypothetical protein